jgi:hypothetical protein
MLSTPQESDFDLDGTDRVLYFLFHARRKSTGPIKNISLCHCVTYKGSPKSFITLSFVGYWLNGRLLRLGSIVHRILLIWPWLYLVPSLCARVAVEWRTCQCVCQFAPKKSREVPQGLCRQTALKGAEIHSRLCAQCGTTSWHYEVYVIGHKCSKMIGQV